MAELTIEKSVTINRPADDVYEFIADHRNAVKFRRNVHSEEHLGGGKVKSVRRHFGRRVEVEGQVAADPQNRKLTFTGQANTGHGAEQITNEQTVTPQGDNSSTLKVRTVTDIGDPPGPVRAHIEKVTAHELESNLEHLKHLLEAPEGFHEAVEQHFASS